MEQNNIPKDIAQVYSHMWQELAWLHTYWDNYCQLHANDEDAVNLLNRLAPAYFGINQKVWDEFIILQISKLTDPAQTGKKNNLSFERLVNLVDETQNSALKVDLEADLRTLQKLSEATRDNRNRRIAHIDLPTYENSHPNPLENVDKNNIDAILNLMRVMLNKIEGHFNNSETIFESPIMPGNAETLLYWLRKADANRRKRHQEE